jgi:hypothetical protein
LADSFVNLIDWGELARLQIEGSHCIAVSAENGLKKGPRLEGTVEQEREGASDRADRGIDI